MTARRPLTREHLERMAVPACLWRSRFDAVPESGRTLLGAYIARLDEMVDRGIGLLILGAAGVGKSGALAVVGKEARARGHTALYTTVWDLREAVRARAPFDNDETMFDRARGVGVLMLDNLRAEDGAEMVFNRRSLEELLSERANRARPTLVTTRMTLREIDDVKNGWKNLLSAGKLVTVALTGPDRHAAQVAELSTEFKGAK